MGDRELIRAIKQGDGDSARELVDKYYPLILRYCAQLSYKDIGRLMGVPPKTAQSRVRLALRALRKEKP